MSNYMKSSQALLLIFLSCNPLLNAMNRPDNGNDKGKIKELARRLSKDPITPTWQDTVAALECDESSLKNSVADKLFNKKKLIFYKLANYLEHPDMVKIRNMPPQKKGEFLQDNSIIQSSQFAKISGTATALALNHTGDTIALAQYNTGTIIPTYIKNPMIRKSNFQSAINSLAFDQNILHTYIAHAAIQHDIVTSHQGTNGGTCRKSWYFSCNANGKFHVQEGLKNNGDHYVCLENKDENRHFPLPDLKHVTHFVSDDSLYKALIVTQNKNCHLIKRNGVESITFDAMNFVNFAPSFISTVDMTKDGKCILICNEKDGYITKEKVSERIKYNFSCKDVITAAKFTTCGKFLVLAFSTTGFDLYDLKNDVILSLCNPAEHTMTCLALSGDGDTIAAGSDFGILITSCKALRALPAMAKIVLSRLELEKDNDELIKTPIFKKIFDKLDPELKQKIIGDFKIEWKKLDISECRICLERPALSITPCNHSFCSECLNNWIKKHKTCPLCRKEI